MKGWFSFPLECYVYHSLNWRRLSCFRLIEIKTALHLFERRGIWAGILRFGYSTIYQYFTVHKQCHVCAWDRRSLRSPADISTNLGIKAKWWAKIMKTRYALQTNELYLFLIVHRLTSIKDSNGSSQNFYRIFLHVVDVPLNLILFPGIIPQSSWEQVKYWKMIHCTVYPLLHKCTVVAITGYGYGTVKLMVLLPS